jgi:TonB family protein
LAGRATRWAWIAALAGSFVIPTAAWLRPEAFSSVAVPLPPLAVADPADAIAPLPADAPEVAAVAPANAFSLSDLDGALRWGWGASSALVLCVLGAAALRLAVLQRRWRASLVDGRAVLVSENVGPAVAGLWRPDVIVPGWALALSEPQRRLMLSHEEEHVRAADPWLLACGATALVLMPWNPALWWQVRRLRLAVEIDCDARVLARGGTAPEYGELLLQVGWRRARLALAAPALGEPASFLERRIRRMATALPRWRWAGAAAAVAVAVGGVVAACEAPRPVSPEAALPITTITIRPATQERVDSVMARYLRPLIRKSLERYYPDLLREQSGPPVDVWFGHDSDLRVSHIARTTNTAGEIGSDRIRSIFPVFQPGNDGWVAVNGRALKGLVRDNVRVTMVHLSASNGEVSPDTGRRVMPVMGGMIDGSSRQAAVLVRQQFPQLLRGREEPVYVWIVLGANGQLVAKGTSPRVMGRKAISTEWGARLMPGYDTLIARQAREYGAIGYGVLAPNSPPVLWVRLDEDGTGAAQDAEPVFLESRVDQRPEKLAGPEPQVPDLLRRAGIEGRVIVRAIVGPNGRAEPASVEVLESPHPALSQVAKSIVLRSLFRPGRLGGRSVRVTIDLPIDFRLKG